MEKINKVLVLAPHPDDMEFGCGGFVSRLIEEGKEIRLVVFSDCAKSLPHGLTAANLIEEQITSARILGLSKENIDFLDFSVRDFPKYRQEILEKLVEYKSNYNPDLVLCPSNDDWHQDHKTVCNESIRAFKSCTILGYELPWNAIDSKINYHVRLSEHNLTKKSKAISCFRSQNFRPYFSPDLFFSLARLRGTQIRTEYAEGFELIKGVI